MINLTYARLFQEICSPGARLKYWSIKFEIAVKKAFIPEKLIMASYDEETTELLKKASTIHETCTLLQTVLSQWISPALNHKGLEKLLDKKHKKLHDTHNQMLQVAESKCSTDLSGTKLGEAFGVLANGQDSICQADALLYESIKRQILGTISAFLDLSWPSLNKEMKVLENFRVDYDSTLKKLSKQTDPDKKSKIETSVTMAKEKFNAQLPRTVHMLKSVNETEGALLKGVTSLAECQVTYYKDCLKSMSGAYASLQSRTSK